MTVDEHIEACRRAAAELERAVREMSDGGPFVIPSLAPVAKALQDNERIHRAAVPALIAEIEQIRIEASSWREKHDDLCARIDTLSLELDRAKAETQRAEQLLAEREDTLP